MKKQAPFKKSRIQQSRRVVSLTRDAVLCIVDMLKSPIDVGRLRMVCRDYARWINPEKVQKLYQSSWKSWSVKWCACCGNDVTSMKQHKKSPWLYYGNGPFATVAEIRESLNGIQYEDWSTAWIPPKRVNSIQLKKVYKELVEAEIVTCKCSELLFHYKATHSYIRCKHDSWCYACLCDKKDDLVEQARDLCDELDSDESGDDLYPPTKDESD
jgi:hypothetical protein